MASDRSRLTPGADISAFLDEAGAGDPALAHLLGEIRACTVCVDTPRGKPMPHAPRPVLRASASARILVASQAPGTKVHLTGLTFNDASGDRLRQWMGVTPAEFYDTSRVAIVPMGFCFPGQDASGGDLPPRRECASQWHDRLFAAMPAFDLVLVIGRPAQLYHLKRLGRHAQIGASLTETVANWRMVREAGARPKVYALPHPSWRNTGWLKRNPWFEADLLPELQADVAHALRVRDAT
ncbi:uracil-DNA glycosylase [Azorhizobium oxalatiphilum]|uniref:Uracil-DNA glycosylase n=1 Tax=Azorhizobium oxalatiphilum TaxID=980631 RepID=A0A917BME8_9HYPH|nr:uracil-DNA glycosylase family protein [Azorhizobium oxalatiphilum]GGF51759.1 uracil-DNA glycosylase [Azorhizobium oxalatiphilum]